MDFMRLNKPKISLPPSREVFLTMFHKKEKKFQLHENSEKSELKKVLSMFSSFSK